MTRFRSLFTALAVAVLLAVTGLAHAAMQWNVLARNASLNGVVTALGANATAKWYSAACAGVANSAAGTLLATLTFGSTSVLDANTGTAGSVASGVLTFGGYTQVNSSHVNGTPQCVRFSTSGGTAVIEVGVAGTGTSSVIGFSGTIAAGQNITGTLTITAGNP